MDGLHAADPSIAVTAAARFACMHAMRHAASNRWWIDLDGPKFGQANTTTKTLICPDWETSVVPISQPGTPVRDKKGCPFVPGLATGIKGPFFMFFFSQFFFYFNYTFAFQLNLCIGIQCV